MDPSIVAINQELRPFAVLLVGWTIVQAMLFVRLALKLNRKHELLDRREMKDCIQTGSVSVIGPALNAGFFALTLISVIGPVLTYMRLSVIGNGMMELGIATRSASVLDLVLGQSPFSRGEFSLVVCGLFLFGVPYQIAARIVLPTMDRIVSPKKEKNARPSFALTAVGSMALGICVYNALQNISSLPTAAGYFGTFLAYVCFDRLSKEKYPWMIPYVLIFSMILGMIAAQVVASLLSL